MLALAPDGSAAQMDEAVAAAKAAFPAWSGLSGEERSTYLTRYADALDTHRDELARLLTLERGKPLHSMASVEVDYAVFWVREVAKRKLPIETIEDTDEHVVQVHHTPLGVVGAITPWNFPILLGLWKEAPCLITGNTVMSSGSGNLKRITLELGGNHAAIVLPGADVSQLVPTLFDAAYATPASGASPSSGSTCTRACTVGSWTSSSPTPPPRRSVRARPGHRPRPDPEQDAVRQADRHVRRHPQERLRGADRWGDRPGRARKPRPGHRRRQPARRQPHRARGAVRAGAADLVLP